MRDTKSILGHPTKVELSKRRCLTLRSCIKVDIVGGKKRGRISDTGNTTKEKPTSANTFAYPLDRL